MLLCRSHLLIPERDFVVADEDGRRDICRSCLAILPTFIGCSIRRCDICRSNITPDRYFIDPDDARNLPLAETLRRQLRDGSVSV